eukprot:TRINITY_DN26576_c0_g1_i1.p1 TRINITY_DN26576_c0_g1~~TRINITY_DN26576_c0_g1_i1.p1  ORF type:complete len:541 (+),score=141.36 TRINITY_DN26576_c0_g1_i1:60-1625(+)
MPAEKRAADAAGTAAAPAGKRRRWDVGTDGEVVKRRPRISSDVYPDPEPDAVPAPPRPTAALPPAPAPAQAPPLSARDGAALLRQLVPTLAAPQPRVRVNKRGELVNELGEQVTLNAGSVRDLALNKRRSEDGKSSLLPKPEEEEDSTFYDWSLPRQGVSGGRRIRSLTLTQPGKHVQEAAKMRSVLDARQQFLERRKAADIAARQGSSMVVDPVLAVAPAPEDDDADLLPVPDCEWWDSMMLANRSYEDITDGGVSEWQLRVDKITAYVEHPVAKGGPNMPVSLPPEPLRLTQKERKKLRTQNRIAREKEKQEKIRRGLLPKPVPKVRISNIHVVKNREAVQDPTVVEKFVREEAAARVRRHDERNEERRLTADERRAKNIAKAKKEAATDSVITLFRVRSLHHGQARWKIQEEAKNRFLTGLLVITPAMNIVIAEGGAKPQRKFANLLLRRIDYREEAEQEAAGPCAEQVWQGCTDARTFTDFRVNNFSTVEKAKRYLSEIGCSLYWDMAANKENPQDA